MAFNRVLPLLFYTGLLLGWLPVPCLSEDPTPPPIKHENNLCIWYDQCSSSPYGTKTFYNCLYNGPPKNLSDQSPEFVQLLNETCPDIVAEGRGVCCNEKQLNTLATQIKYPQQLFGRCPACLKNFIDHFCLTTCDPDQAAWMEPTSIVYDKDLDKFSIGNVDLYITLEYAETLYSSCKNVQYPQASTRVVDIMCGTTECNATKWLTYLGDPTLNNESPFPMHYKYSATDEIVPKTYDFMECNTTDVKYQCSCSDCNAKNVCPPPPTPFPNDFPYFDVTITIATVGASLSLIIFTVAMIAALISVRSQSGYTRIDTSSSGRSRGKYGAIIEDDNDSPTSSVGSINADETDVQDNKDDDHPSHSSSLCGCWFQMGSWIEYGIKWAFYHWGRFVAKYWYIVFFFVALVVIALSCGLFFFQITTTPVDLWTSPTSRAREEKVYFDKHFNPFYRTEMIIVTAPKFNNSYYQPDSGINANWTFGPVMNIKVLEEVLNLQNELAYMEVPYTDDNGTVANITLSNICYKPLAPQNKNCTIMSVLNYFQNSLDNLHRTAGDFGQKGYQDHMHYCTRNPTDPKGITFNNPYMPCLAEFGGPVDPNVALGGFGYEPNGSPDYQSATALIITFIVNNHINETNNKMAETWETEFLKRLKDYKGTYINITYSAERSIEDEIERESQAEITTILISYLLMFVYIMFFLGHIRSIRTLLVDMKISIGLIGVLMVLVAVVSSIGLLSYIGVMNTLIILEVVPFLVLAVGVDNFFILIHSYEREACKFVKHHNGDLSKVCIRELIGRSIGEVAPSLLLTSLSETAAFLLGGVSTMPAVRSFSFYAGVAVFFNFLLQISVFVGLMALDAHRQLANRVDVLFCIKLKGMFDPTMGLDIIHFVMKYFAKLILHPLVRPFVLLFFGLTSTASLALLFRVEVGLDQTLALPKDSYLVPYFNETFTYLHTGAPVYFVIKEGYDYTNETKQNAICSGAGCLPSSIGQQIVQYSSDSKMTKIAEPAMLWLDTYFEWIAPKSYCCGISRDEAGEECFDPAWANDTCDTCKTTPGDRPNKTEFETYLYWFLQDNPGIDCPSGGHAAFGGAVILNQTDKVHHKNSSVITSYIMTYHTVLKTSNDFISALRWARRLADNVSAVMEWEVFPYSVFYVFYEQYLTTVHDMALNLGLSIAAVFFVTVLMFGLNIWAAAILMLVVCMIILHMFGCMHLLGINANAVSLVNLVMTVGISVEFCSHIVRWFVSHIGRRRERAQSALDHMGASVFSGITVTKFLGVFVLLFAKSRLFNIYYFRMYMLMLFWGALHGLVFLPVILSYIGPPNIRFTKKPYHDLELKVEEETTTKKKNSIKEAEKRKLDASKARTYPSMYPSLSGTHSSGSQSQQAPPQPTVVPAPQPAQDYQGYGAPTYPQQQVYQQQGVAYGTGALPNEQSRLINQ